MSVFSNRANIINMHQFRVHTEHTKISDSIYTSVFNTHSGNGSSSNLLILWKIFQKQFQPEFPFILIKSLNINFFI